MKHLQHILIVGLILGMAGISGCRTGSAAGGSDATAAESRSLAPQRVDIRGSIVTTRYNEGQVVLEVEAFAPSLNSLYDRAYVLVLPTAQLIGSNGQPISLSELRMGQTVAILLRGGGNGNRVGVGVARKLWVEDSF
ncbi:hypothetical protein ACSX1A_05650 [Pontibacter sp. MBLB2868]|uniref:hypothetical protein n=1 Tax=Pontibacter sp. MBLB2868 TaxID=3451555 RepID=UPI003F74E660